MSWFSDLFKTQKSQTYTAPWNNLQNLQIGTAEDLGNYLRQFVGDYKPGETYTGKLTTTATPFESAGLGILGNYLNTPATGALSGAAQNQLMGTLSGAFADPSQSPYIQAMQKIGQRNLEENIDSSRLGQGARGKFYSTKALEEEGKIRTNSLDNLNAMIGGFIQNERQNMLNAVPQAMSLEKYQKDAPLQQVAASQNYGSLQRVLDQANMEAAYNEWARQRGELSGATQQASNFAFQQLPYNISQWSTPKQNSPFQGIMGNLLGSGAGMLLNSVLPGIGGLIGSGLGSLFGNTANISGIGSVPVAPPNYYLR